VQKVVEHKNSHAEVHARGNDNRSPQFGPLSKRLSFYLDPDLSVSIAATT